MHLVCDARCVHPHMGGIGQSALALLRRFSLNGRGHRITAIVTAQAHEDLASSGISLVPVEAGMIDEHFDQIGLPSVLADLEADVYLNFTFSVPAVKTAKVQIAVIHDVVFEDHPEWVEASLAGYLRRWSRFAAMVADRVITVSDHARQRILHVYGIHQDRVVRIYNAVPDNPSNRKGLDTSSLDCPGNNAPFVLHLGTLEDKKGTPELLSAFGDLVRSGFSGELILAGAVGRNTASLDEQIQATGVSGRIRKLGYICETSKQALLRRAAVLVYPSRYEGFGLPPLEGMALGTPCVVSDSTSLPEVVGDVAIVVDVTDRRRFVEGLRKALEDESFRAYARIAGPHRAATFSWDQAAEQYLDVCTSALSAANGSES